ncbi:MAG: phosphoribosylamine--glycine ligase, partial [Firmicutes bacterium]|nr:phosphoribosylamine--glycine ligase [Bacillota bacterium]
IFHAGTKFDGNDIVTSGGRVLGASALGKDHDEARAKAYELAKKIHFDGAHFRNDIGLLHSTE